MSGKPTQLKWVDFKTLVTSRALSLQWRRVKGVYQLVAFDGPFRTECVIRFDSPPNADQLDFETNFKNVATKPVIPADNDGSALQRPKYSPPGWTYQLRSMEFETSTLGSLRSKKVNPGTKVETEWGDITLKFFNEAGAELTDQTVMNTECVWTQVDFEPPFDIEIVGGAVRLLQELVTDVYLSIIGAPDLPASYGGTKYFVADVNLNYIPAQGAINADGRTSKKLTYDPVYHTNKMRALFRHVSGVKHKIQINYEFYRS